jgi:F-type H+-transporting ATPase subunit b
MSTRKWLPAAVFATALLLPVLSSVASAAGGVLAATPEHGGDPELIKIPPGRTELITSVTTLLIFCVLVAVLGKFAWNPIVSGLKKREEKIRKEISDAEEARARAEQTLKEYNTRLAAAEQQVRDMLNKAAAEGQQIAAGIRTQAQQEAEEAKERATRDIESARDRAVAELYEVATDLAVGVAEKILQRNINADDQRELVKRSLEQLHAAGAGKNGG